MDAIRSHSFTFDGKTLYTTLSIGLVAAATGSTDDIDALIHQADVNLYQAKENVAKHRFSENQGFKLHLRGEKDGVPAFPCCIWQ